MEMTNVFIVYVKNQFGVLSRISSVFGRRGCNIHSLTVFPTERQSVSLMTLVVLGHGEKLRQIYNQMEKMEDVLSVTLTPQAYPAEQLTNKEAI